MEAYTQEIKHVELLDHAEEIELGRRAHQGDVVARNKLIAANLRLVVKIAHEFRIDRAKLQDLIQEGNIGLIRAAEKFDPDMGFRFSTYAANWIKAKIKKFVIKDRNIVSVRQGKEARILQNLRRVERELGDQGIDPTDEAIAEILKVKPRDIREMRGRLVGQDSGLVSVGPDGEETSMDVEDHSLRPDRIFEEQDFGTRFHEVKDAFAATLKGRDWVLFTERVVHEDPAKLTEIAEHYKVTRECVRLWEVKLKNRFQVYLNRAFGVGCHLAA